MKKLLLIDNSTVIINVLKDLFLKKNHYNLYVAKSLNEAKKLIDNHKFFVSISNLVLPDALNGELLSLLKSNQIPTIVLTSKINSETILNIKNIGVIDYISKESFYELQKAYNLANLLLYIKDMNVLIVDDSAIVISQLKSSLEGLLLNVSIANSGKSALRQLEQNPNISLIITDYHMDEMNGLEFIKSVRKGNQNNTVPILVMTSDNNNELKVNLYKNGATDFLVKPLLEEELKAKIFNTFLNMKQINDIKSYTEVIDNNVITSFTDENGVILNVSQAFCEISGYTREELIGQNHKIVRHPDMPEFLYEELWSVIKSGKIWKGEVKNIKKDGSSYWVKVVIEPNFDREGNITNFTSVRQDITDKKRIYELSITDGLTGLYNRRYFNEISNDYIDNSLKNNNYFAFLILDIDNFKKYNDTYGHQKGDEVLISVSESLEKSFKRQSDKIFRLGGEEFGVLVSAKKQEDIKKLVEKARIDIQNLGIIHEKNLPLNVITASFGLTILKDNFKRIEEIYKSSDKLLYKAKESGRNKLIISAP